MRNLCLLILILIFAASCSSSGVKRRKGCKGTGSWDGKRNLSLIKQSSEQRKDKSNSDRSCFIIYSLKSNETV
jgi:hypothetical protein